MAYPVRILPQAWEDLKKIEDGYLIEFGAETALKVTDHILDSISRLELYPDTGSLTPDDWLNEKGYRMVICQRHVAIYRRFDDGIYIYHIADTRTDYVKLFHIQE